MTSGLTLVKVKFVGLDSWEYWEQDLEGFATTLLAEMGPMVTAAKIISLLLICLCEVNWRSQ